MTSACRNRKFLNRNQPSLISNLLSIISPIGQFTHSEHCLS